MKSRRVMVMLEVETSLPLRVLRTAWRGGSDVLQVQANVVKQRSAKRRPRRKA